MKNKNLMLLAGAGVLAFFLLRKKTSTGTETARKSTTIDLSALKRKLQPQNFQKFATRKNIDGVIY